MRFALIRKLTEPASTFTRDELDELRANPYSALMAIKAGHEAAFKALFPDASASWKNENGLSLYASDAYRVSCRHNRHGMMEYIAQLPEYQREANRAMSRWSPLKGQKGLNCETVRLIWRHEQKLAYPAVTPREVAEAFLSLALRGDDTEALALAFEACPDIGKDKKNFIDKAFGLASWWQCPNVMRQLAEHVVTQPCPELVDTYHIYQGTRQIIDALPQHLIDAVYEGHVQEAQLIAELMQKHAVAFPDKRKLLEYSGEYTMPPQTAQWLVEQGHIDAPPQPPRWGEQRYSGEHEIDIKWLDAAEKPKEMKVGSEQLERLHNAKTYQALQPLVQLATLSEGNYDTSLYTHADDSVRRDSFRLSVIFSHGTALQYLEKWSEPKFSDSKQPVHDALLFDLPKGDAPWTPRLWSQYLLNHGVARVGKYVAVAPIIEQGIEALNQERIGRGQEPLEPYRLAPSDLRDIYSKHCYTSSAEHPELARLCASNALPEEQFDACLAIMQSQVKTKDHIPDPGFISGKPLGLDRYYLVKLAPDDPRNLLIGHMSECCCRIDHEAGAQMAKAQVTSPDFGCYVVARMKQREPDLSKDLIVGKVTAWRSKQGNLVFNSWERRNGYAHLGLEKLLGAAAQKILNDPSQGNISRVLLGTNRDNCEEFQRVDDPEAPRWEGIATRDSETQYLVASRRMLRAKEACGAARNLS